jgi:4-hydroxy 2-oxovalerate aldolase
MSDIKNFKIMDCTLRDGGFHTKWDFKENLVKNYVEAINLLEVSEVEIGFRFTNKTGWMGRFAYTTEDTLNKYQFKEGIDLGVMIFSGDLLKDGVPDFELIEKIFPLNSDKTKLRFIRVATYLDNINNAVLISKYLQEKGFNLSLHLMKVHNTSEKEFLEIGSIGEENSIDRVYFADSLGSMGPSEIKKTVLALKKEFSGPIGLHAHNNKGFALINSVAAIEAGATWVDGTITGIGRGPGNTKLEELVFNFFENKENNYQKLIELVENDFEPLQKIYNWGSNPYYFLAGMKNIHPSYVQDLLQNNKFDKKDTLSFILDHDHVNKEDYNPEYEDISRLQYSDLIEGTFSPSDNLTNEEYLIVGSGPSVLSYKEEIEEFIRSRTLGVLQLNSGKTINDDLISYKLFSHPQTIAYEERDIKNSKNKIIIPPKIISNEENFKHLNTYGIEIDSSIESFSSYCKIPNALVFSYALATLSQPNIKKIFFCGIDGYKENNHKTQEINDSIRMFREKNKNIELISLTPTIQNLEQVSVFELLR